MVRNSFGKRNFMQPMEGPSMHSTCLAFFPFKSGGGERFFSFSPGSWFVPTMFLLSCQCVLIRLPIFPQVLNVFPNMFSIAAHFDRTCFGKCCPRFTYIGGPKGRIKIFQNRTFYFGESPKFHLFWVMGQSNWLVVGKKNWTGEAPHLINMRGE